MSKPRYLHDPIQTDLTDKMVFLAGPRQVGKATLARPLLAEMGAGSYLNSVLSKLAFSDQRP
jgi:predicted AAA+ superfamily ATPase